MGSISEKELKETMEGMFNVLMESVDREAQEDPLFAYLESKKEWFGDPGTMDTMIMVPFKNIIKQIVKESIGKDGLVGDIFVNWAFYSRNTSSLCSSLYGSGCSVDRGNWILRQAIGWKNSGKLPVFTGEEKHYWIPKSGTPEQWMEFVEGLGGLRLGNPRRYLVAYQSLIIPTSGG